MHNFGLLVIYKMLHANVIIIVSNYLTIHKGITIHFWQQHKLTILIFYSTIKKKKHRLVINIIDL